ncbi:MAG TPA: DegT/DnrJ/EryC1/StrS family aminotransferase [Candidatus Binatia bacterium]|nr:DegT/DnrJ/EryC1/StrS family aminotransferase [Candidatus Binatia bacterium]
MAKLPSYLAMRVPLLDLSEQYRTLADPIREAINDVLASGRFILGPKVEAFEKAISAYCNTSHAVGVSSGTDALLTILMALEIGRGDAVITTPYTFFATAGCIARVGATPLFADIDPETYNIRPSGIQGCIEKNCRRNSNGEWTTQNGEKIRAIIPVHLFGLCCQMDALHEISARYRLDVIEDAAQAIGAEFPFRERIAKAGTMGEVGFFSFYPSKNLGAAGDAGTIVCRDEELAQKLRTFREHGMEPRYFHHFIGGNFRLDEIQAAILAVKLPYLERWAATRRAAADFYGAELARAGLTEKISPPSEPYRERGLTNHHVYHQYVVRTPMRDALREHLGKRGIGTAIYYPLGLHEQKCFAYLGYKRGDFPETERAAGETLALPIYPEISREAQRYVVSAIAEFFS